MNPSLAMKTYLYEPMVWGAGAIDFAISPNGLLLAAHCSPDDIRASNNLFVYDLDGKVRFSGNSPWAEGNYRGLAFWQDHQHLILPQPIDLDDFSIASGLAVINLGIIDKVEKPFAGIETELSTFHNYQIQAQGQLIFIHGNNSLTCINAGFAVPQVKVIPNVTGGSHIRVAPNARAVAVFSPVAGSQVFHLPDNGNFSDQPARLIWECSGAEAGFIAFSRDGRSFLVRENFNQLCLHSIQGAGQSSLYKLTVDAVTGDFSPDGKLLVIAGRDSSISLLDTRDFALLQTLPGAHSAEIMPVRQVQFSLDSRRLISIGEHDAIIWEVVSNGTEQRIV